MHALQRVFSLSLSAAVLAGCATSTVTPVAAPAAPVAAVPVQAAVVSAPDDKSAVVREWTFAGGTTDGWLLGWSTSEETAVKDIAVEDGLGMKLTMNFGAKGWGDSNLKLAWTTPQAPAAISVRVLVPAENNKPKGPMQIGCAMNDPWAEAKSWPELKLAERVTVAGKDYLAQTVVCRIGPSSAQHKALILRFGGENVRYKGPLYIQNIRALRSVG